MLKCVHTLIKSSGHCKVAKNLYLLSELEPLIDYDGSIWYNNNNNNVGNSPIAHKAINSTNLILRERRYQSEAY